MKTDKKTLKMVEKEKLKMDLSSITKENFVLKHYKIDPKVFATNV